MASTDLIYSNLVPSAERETFLNKVISVARNLDIDPNWLMQVMKAESGIRADIENTYAPFKDGFATGLIQFTPATARGLKTTTLDLKKMTRTQQLDYVNLYFLPYRGRIKSYFDLYLVTFFPVAIKNTNDDSWVFETSKISRSSVAKSNPIIDRNKDGLITMGEFKEYVRSTVPKNLQSVVFKTAAIGGSTLLVIVLIFLIFKS